MISRSQEISCFSCDIVRAVFERMPHCVQEAILSCDQSDCSLSISWLVSEISCVSCDSVRCVQCVRPMPLCFKDLIFSRVPSECSHVDDL